jgi:hypothetical protein
MANILDLTANDLQSLNSKFQSMKIQHYKSTETINLYYLEIRDLNHHTTGLLARL